MDLAGSALSAVGSVALGRSAIVKFTVADDGNIPAKAAPMEILASADGMVSDGIELAMPNLVLNLPANVTRTYRLRFKMPTALAIGSFVLVVVLDPNNTLDDPNLSNNVIVGETTFSNL